MFTKLLVSVRVSIAVKRHCDHGNSYQGKSLIGWLTFPEHQFIIIWYSVVLYGGVQADVVLEKELKVLHLDS